MVMTIQSDLIPALIEEYPSELVQDENEDITIEFENPAQLEMGFKSANLAFRRQFNSEEQECGICMRRLLGEKFSFLTSCEHFYCTECLIDMVCTKINEG